MNGLQKILASKAKATTTRAMAAGRAAPYQCMWHHLSTVKPWELSTKLCQGSQGKLPQLFFNFLLPGDLFPCMALSIWV